MLISHILRNHDPWLLALAIGICLLGAASGILLWNRALQTADKARNDWSFLAAIVLGATIWTTHFVSMLGYTDSAQAAFDVKLTALSVAAAVIGVMISVHMTLHLRNIFGHLAAGTTLGVAISVMHFIGMVGYQTGADIPPRDLWSPDAFLVGVAMGIVSVRLLDFEGVSPTVPRGSTLSFSLAVAGVHFTAMAYYHQLRLVSAPGGEQESHIGLAIAVSLMALVLIGVGISIHLTQMRLTNQATEELRRNATTDALTGALNREGFDAELRELTARREKEGPNFVLLFIDLDRFKPVNDVFGHHIGDKVLQRSVERIRAVVRTTDIVARLGGDEFAIILTDIDTASNTDETVAVRVLDLIARPFIVQSRIIQIGASIGIAEPSEHGVNDPQELCRNADMALYAAKSRGRNTWCRFARDIQQSFEERSALERDLRRAVAREEFELVYQPIFETCTGKIVAAEALLRWRHPTRGMLVPEQFLRCANELGVITQIGKRSIETACETAMTWEYPINVAVNLSSSQIRDARIVQIIRNALRSSGLPACRLELEITEAALLDNTDRAKDLLDQLHEIGVKIAIDDFGVGPSSIQTIQTLPISCIKIDHSLTASSQNDPESARLFEAISQLGHTLGLDVTAEGIETDAQLRMSERHGCTSVQGFLLGTPLPASELGQVFARKACLRKNIA